MSFITVGKENSLNIDLHYQDYGQGKPVVLIHGYPQNGSAWEKQISPLLKMGKRVVTYDRRGFGESSKPSTGYDYNTFAADLNKVLETLDLKEVTLIGHSMGSGEIVRYLANYGSSRITKAVLISPLQPFLLKTEDNPEGLDKSLFEGFKKAASEDRYAFLKTFFHNFYSSGLVGHKGVSDELLEHNRNIGAEACAVAIEESIMTWISDFRPDLPKIKVPTLIIQGTHDKVLPFKITGEKLTPMIPGSKLVAIDGASHGLLWTHATEVNAALAQFLE